MTPEHPSNPRELTNADRIRSLTDDELAEIISADMVEEKTGYCQNKKECSEILDSDGIISAEMCKQCALEWLKKPARGKQND